MVKGGGVGEGAVDRFSGTGARGAPQPLAAAAEASAVLCCS